MHCKGGWEGRRRNVSAPLRLRRVCVAHSAASRGAGRGRLARRRELVRQRGALADLGVPPPLRAAAAPAAQRGGAAGADGGGADPGRAPPLVEPAARGSRRLVRRAQATAQGGRQRAAQRRSPPRPGKCRRPRDPHAEGAGAARRRREALRAGGGQSGVCGGPRCGEAGDAVDGCRRSAGGGACVSRGAEAHPGTGTPTRLRILAARMQWGGGAISRMPLALIPPHSKGRKSNAAASLQSLPPFFARLFGPCLHSARSRRTATRSSPPSNCSSGRRPRQS